MKRILFTLLTLCMALALLACGSGKVTSGTRPQEAAADIPAQKDAAAEPAATAETVPAVTAEPTATPEPTPEPTATPAPVTQQTALDKQLLGTKGVNVRLTGLSFAKNYELTLEYELANSAERAVSLELLLNSANCWSLAAPTAEKAGDEYYQSRIVLEAGASCQASVRYWLGDPAVAMMGIDQIDHFSARVQAQYEDTGEWIADKTTYVEVTGAPEPGFVYPAGDTLLESDPLTVTSLGYDAKAERIYLYIAHKVNKSGGSLIIYPAVNGVAVTDKSLLGDYPGLYLSTTNNKQLIVGLDVGPLMDELGVASPSSLAVCINLQNSNALPVTLNVPLDDPAPAWTMPDYDVVSETDDILVQYAGLREDAEGDRLIFYITNKTETEFLISAKDEVLQVDGVNYKGTGCCPLPPGIVTCLSLTLKDQDYNAVSGLSGTGMFTFDYSPFIKGTTYYSGARYTGKITVALP